MTRLNERAKHSWGKWNRQLLNDDVRGNYFAFTLTTHLTYPFLKRKLERRCAYAMDKRGLAVPLTDRDAMPSRTSVRCDGIAVYVLPAVSAHEHKHFHGLIRVPKQSSLTVMTIRTNEQPAEIVVPLDVMTVFQTRFGKGHDYAFRDINVLHDHLPRTHDGAECVGTALPLNDSISVADHRVHQYWQKTSDGERREFGEGDWIPNWVRLALPSADTTKLGLR